MEKRHSQAEKNLEELKSSAIEASESVMGDLKAKMGDEGFSLWVEFNSKWTKFKREGRNREAELLRVKYLKENG